MLDVQDFWVSFNSGDEFAVQSARLRLNSGSLNLLWGPNGSGKSSFLRALADDQALDQTARWSSLGTQRSNCVSYVAQHAPFAPGDCVDAFLAFYRSAQGYCETEYSRLSKVLGVCELIWMPIGSLSGGQWKRVQCCAQLSLRRPVYLLDEPDAALDRGARAVLADELSRKAKTMGATVLVASHHVEWLAGRTDTLTVFKKGQIVWHSPMAHAALARDLLTQD